MASTVVNNLICNTEFILPQWHDQMQINWEKNSKTAIHRLAKSVVNDYLLVQEAQTRFWDFVYTPTVSREVAYKKQDGSYQTGALAWFGIRHTKWTRTYYVACGPGWEAAGCNRYKPYGYSANGIYEEGNADYFYTYRVRHLRLMNLHQRWPNGFSYHKVVTSK